MATQQISGAVRGRVEILRDRSGVPHVYATDTHDLYFGLGFAMAEDRLWQMDRLRRRALGRQAEILGSAYLASDIAHLTVGIDQIAAREVDAMDEATRQLVLSLVAGINRCIEQMGRDLPPEFRKLGYEPEPFAVRDVVAIARGIWWSLNGRIDRIVAAEAARLLPEQFRAMYLTPEASEHRVMQHAAGSDDATGSNNWAVHGSRSASGKPVLCGDPHQPFWVPSTWYEYALHGPEDDVAGAGHPGFPGMWWGSNGDIAWAITNNMASTRDLYVEQVDPADLRRYRDGDAWRAFDERRVDIKVRGASAHALTIRSTVRGPIVNALVPALDAAGDPPLALRWIGMEHMDDIRASIAVGRARDWQAFRDALRDWSVAIFNFVYADARGHIGYQMAGRIPIRGRVVPGFRDANDPADRWFGTIPFDDLPHMYDPPSGYVASANQRIVPDDWKHPIYGAYSQGHRGVRLDQALGGGSLDQAANVALQNDVKNCRAERSCPHILRHLGDAEPAFARLLGDWDYRYALTAVAPTVFEAFMALWQREVIGQHVPERLLDLTHQQTGLAASLLEDPSIAYFADGTTPHVIAVAQRTLATLREGLGDDVAGWQWGRLHQAHWHHPVGDSAFDIGPREVDGGSHTLRNTGGELPPHAASSGAEYRIVVDFATPDSFLAVQNIGNSGVPDSPHYRDQFEPWLRGEYHVVHLRRAAVEADCESAMAIVPG
ncbi:MAG TPA: penicillin acylase family protein [Acetobacteraceae bacterium]|nr:penicillin acylase family protein [Acetobacteraceae bacterium]